MFKHHKAAKGLVTSIGCIEDKILYMLKRNNNVALMNWMQSSVGLGNSTGNSAFENALNKLQAYGFIVIAKSSIHLSGTGIKWFETLNKKNFEQPYSYFIKEEKQRLKSEYWDKWRKRYWVMIMAGGLVLTSILSLIAGMYLERWKQQNLTPNQPNRSLKTPGQK